MNFKLKKISDEVYYSNIDLCQLDIKDIKRLIFKTKKKGLQKFRICFHKNINDKIHQMLIYHSKNYKCKPHKNNYPETTIILDGKMDLIFYNKAKKIKKIVKMGNYTSKRKFFCFIKKNEFASVKIHSKYAIFFEITGGPFIKSKVEVLD